MVNTCVAPFFKKMNPSKRVTVGVGPGTFQLLQNVHRRRLFQIKDAPGRGDAGGSVPGVHGGQPRCGGGADKDLVVQHQGVNPMPLDFSMMPRHRNHRTERTRPYR